MVHSCSLCGSVRTQLMATRVTHALVCEDVAACRARVVAPALERRPFPQAVVASPFTRAALARQLPPKATR